MIDNLESKRPSSFVRVSTLVGGWPAGSGRLEVTDQGIELTLDQLTSRLTGVSQVRHVTRTVHMIHARLLPPWFNRRIILTDPPVSAGVTFGAFGVSRLIPRTLQEHGYSVAERHTLIDLGAEEIRVASHVAARDEAPIHRSQVTMVLLGVALLVWAVAALAMLVSLGKPWVSDLKQSRTFAVTLATGAALLGASIGVMFGREEGPPGELRAAAAVRSRWPRTPYQVRLAMGIVFVWLYGFTGAYGLYVWKLHPSLIPLAGKAAAVVFLIAAPALVRPHLPVRAKHDPGN